MSEINPKLLSLLQCPKDGSALAQRDEALTSESGSEYPIVDGIPCFASSLSPHHAELEVSVLILTLNEAGNIQKLLTDVIDVLKNESVSYEILVVDGGSTDRTREIASAAGATVVVQDKKGYAEGFLQGLRSIKGRYVVTLDGDLSHPAALIPALLRERRRADVIIGSRWIAGGSFEGPRVREILSRTLNLIFKRMLSLPVADLSSGYRLYRTAALSSDPYVSRDFSILEEILVKAYTDGYRITEVPLEFKKRQHGASHVRLVSFACSYIQTLLRMWLLRNDANGCDYDHRAFDTWLIPQRYWQRTRHRNITELLGEYRTKGDVLDVGCGSSRIIQQLPHAVAFDLSLRKLRFLRSTNSLRVSGSAFALPFKDSSFDCVIHSQLIEHLPPEPSLFTELRRILKPGGRLIIGTVDYASWTWPTIERIYGILLPHAYAGEHITHYTLESLQARLKEFGFSPKALRTILKGEITILAERS